MWAEIFVVFFILLIIGLVLYFIFRKTKRGIVAKTHENVVPADPATLLAAHTIPVYTDFNFADKSWVQVSWAMMVVAQKKMYDLYKGNTETNYDDLIPGFTFQSGSEYWSIWNGANSDGSPILFYIFGGTLSGIRAEDQDTTLKSGVKTTLVNRYLAQTIPSTIPRGETIFIGWDSGCTLALIFFSQVVSKIADLICMFYLFGFGQSMQVDPTNLPYPDMYNWITSTTDPYCGTGTFSGFMASTPGISVTTNVSNQNQGHNLSEYFPTIE